MMLSNDCFLIPPAVGDSMMTAIALQAVQRLAQGMMPDLVVADHSRLLFHELFPKANIYTMTSFPEKAWEKLVDFRSDEVSRPLHECCHTNDKFWFDFTTERHIHAQRRKQLVRQPAIAMLEGDSWPDTTKEAAYVMDLELLVAAFDLEWSDLLLPVQSALLHWAAAVPPAGVNIVLVPCTSNRQKMWPLEHWRELAVYLLADGYDVGVVLGPDEADLVNFFPKMVTVHAQQSWDVVCDVFRQSSLVIANDCGPMHVAALFAPRVLAIFGPTDPAVWFPYPAPTRHYLKQASGAWPTIDAVLAQGMGMLQRET